MKNYLDFFVVISPGAGGAYEVRVSSDKSGQCNSTVTLPFTLRDLSPAMLGLAQTARALGSITPREAGSAGAGAADRNFGVELFEALFRDEVRKMLWATQTEAQSSVDTGVRIRLSVDLQAPGMADVASLPWELMCEKTGEYPMALSPQTTLVRALDVPGRTEPPPFAAPLRIMVVMSNPEGTTRLNLDEERRRIEERWGKLLGVKVDFVRPFAKEIREQLRAEEYHVFHYMGHGHVDENGVGTLLLEDPERGRGPDPITGDDLALWLSAEPLRLVFLNACNTGTASVRSGAHPFAGVATALIRKRVPAVVAMQFPITDDAAILFAETFYQCILQGRTVDAAVGAGRLELASNKATASEWATPVLYLRSKDGMLFEWGKNDAPVAIVAPASLVPGAGGATASATATGSEDPWGPGPGDALRVFLATPDQNLARRHGQLSQTLKNLDWVRVIDSVPTAEVKEHAAAVERLVRRADLCVHLLGAAPGMRLDDDDEQPLRTYPLVELDIARQAANSQLVVITREDKDGIGIENYRAMVDDLGKLRRDKERFELVITDKNRITEAVTAKLEELMRARQAKVAPSAAEGTVRHAFVDSYVSDEERAVELVAYLEDRNVSTEIRTSSSPAADFAQLDETVKKSSLYIIVAGRVDSEWVSKRKVAVMKSAVRTKAALVIAKYSATPAEEADSPPVTKSRFDISPMRSDPGWLDALFASSAADQA